MIVSEGILLVYECCHVDVCLESDGRPDISTWRAAKWQRYDMSYCQCMNATMLMCGWNQTGDLTSLPGGLPNGRDMTCLIVSVWMVPCWCVAGIRQETWHLYLESCQMAEIWHVLLSVYECCHVDVWLESDRRLNISTWRAEEWRALLLNVDSWDYNMAEIIIRCIKHVYSLWLYYVGETLLIFPFHILHWYFAFDDKHWDIHNFNSHSNVKMYLT